MTCQEMDRLIQLYLDEELSRKEVSEVEEHMRHCPLCAQKLSRLRKVVSIISDLEVVEPPWGFTDRVMYNLPAHRRSQGLFSKLRSWQVEFAWGALAVAFTLILYLTNISSHLMEQTGGSLNASRNLIPNLLSFISQTFRGVFYLLLGLIDITQAVYKVIYSRGVTSLLGFIGFSSVLVWMLYISLTGIVILLFLAILKIRVDKREK